jgi:VTC domain
MPERAQTSGAQRALESLEPVSLEELDERSKLRRRVDTKYVVPEARVAALVERLGDRYQVLEIDAWRRFTYESVYFDTPDFRCFHEHVEGRRPRFKVRSRYYRETEACFLEVKVKQEGEETVKRQRPYDRDEHGRLTDTGWSFVEETLAEEAGIEPPADLAPTLSTGYKRMTLGAVEGGERATFDLEIALQTMDGRAAALREGIVLVETKTEDGHSRIDDELHAERCNPMSISKYRLGVGLLLVDDPEAARLEELRRCFV